MEESCAPTNSQNKNKTQKLNINGNKRPKQTSNQVDTSYSQKREPAIGGTGKFDLSSSHHPLEGSQKVNKIKSAKEKQKAKEQARYQRKIQKNLEMADMVEKHATRQSTVDTLKEVNKHPPKQSLKDDTSDLEPQKTNDLNANQSLLSTDHNVTDQTKEQSKALARDDDDESSTEKRHCEELHIPAAHTNNEDSVVEEHYIFRLNKKNPRFPHAKFYCRLCNYHLDSLTLCKKHWKEPRHSKLEESKSHQWEIKKIKAPTKAHAGALSTLLKTIVDDTALNQGDIDIRQHIAQTVEKILHKAMPDVIVNVYGSSLSGFGFKDSDVNLSIEVPEGSVPSQVLVMACQALSPGDEIFEDVESDFEGRFPCIRFNDKQSGLRCELSTGSVAAIKTSQLLCDYRKIDPRVHLLAMALRYWARLCGVDSQSDGSMPAYSFVLMTIYFLQHCEPPVVPVLQENEVLEVTNTDSLGVLWVKMLKFYTFDIAIEEIVISVRKREPVSRDELKIPNRRLAIEDPIAVNKKNIAKSLSSNVVFQYVFDRLQDALLYFGKPQKAPTEPATNSKTHSRVPQLQPHSEDIDASDVLTSTSVKGTASVLPSNTVESCTGSGDMGQEHSVNSCSTDLSTDAVMPDYKECSASVLSTLDVSTSDDSEINKNIAGQNSESLVDAIDKMSIDMCHANPRVEDDALRVDALMEVAEYTTDSLDVNKPIEDSATNESGNNQDFHFVFDEKVLTGGKKVMVVCNGCAKEGHQISECPDECLPNLVALPAMDRHYLKRIDALCINIAERYCLKDIDMKHRDKAVENYEWFIQTNGYPDARLQLFGSSRNGFGFSKSDMDICLKFQHQTAEELHLAIPSIVEDLAKKLKRHNNLCNVIPISTAKVPIVKFMDRCMQLDADISLYNCLAQANTRMLYAYSKIDPRVRQLVYTVKVFAKVCDIGDASKGSLSSYAYTLMMIFFLQQRTPSVLPVLQELYQSKEKPKHVVEGCNAWYFSDLHKLSGVWRGSNTESVGELWLGFLRFFTEDFNAKKYVVCIRQHKPLTRFEKMWTGAARGFAIEDPFDLDHNLGGGVSRKMATFIMQVFINAREHFGLPKNIGRFMDDCDFFLDAYVLTGGEAPPNDRCCRVCGKIGHFLKDCPHRKRKKDTNKGRDRDREEGNKGRDRDREEGNKGRDRDREEGNKGRDRDREQGKKGRDRGKSEVKAFEDAQQIEKRNHVPHSPIQDRVYTSRQSMQGANNKAKLALKSTGGGSKTAKIEQTTSHSGTMQQTTAQPPGETKQQVPAKSPAGTLQQTSVQPHGGTTQQTSAQPHVGTRQQAPAKTSIGTMQQTSAQPHAETMQQTSAQPHVGTRQQTSAPPHTGTRQQTSAQPHVGTMQQTSGQPHTGTRQQTSGQPHVGTMQQTSVQPHVGTMQQTSAQPHVGTMQQTSAQPHVGTRQQTSAPPHTGTRQQTSGQPHVGTMQQTSAPPHTGTRQQTSGQPHVGTMQQTSAPPHTGTRQQTSAQPHVGTMQQTSAPPHTGTRQQTSAPPHTGTRQQTSGQPHVGTMQQTSAPPHTGSRQQTSGQPHVGTMQQTSAPPHTGTRQQTSGQPHVGTMQQTSAPPHTGTRQQTSGQPHVGTMQQTSAPPHTGTRQQTSGQPHAGTMQQTTVQVQTKTDMPQQKNIEETWNQHKVDKKQNKKHDQRRGKRSVNTNKTVQRINANRTSVEQSAVEQSVNGTYDQAYPALPTCTMDQSQYVQQKQPGQQQLQQRSQELSDQRLQQYYTTTESQPVHLQAYLSSNNSTAGAMRSVEHLDQQQPLQQHKQQIAQQQNYRFRHPSDKQLDSGSQHWSPMQQHHHHQMQQQLVLPQMQPQQLNNTQADEHTAEGFDIINFAKSLPFHSQPLPTNEKPLQLHEIEAMQIKQQHNQSQSLRLHELEAMQIKQQHNQSHLQNEHLQKQLSQQHMLQHHNQGRFQQQQQKPYQLQNQQQKHFNQQQQHLLQKQQNLQQYQEQWNQPNQQQLQALQQQQQQQCQAKQHQQEDNRIQSSQSLSSSPSSRPMTRQGSLLDTYHYQSVPDTFGAEGGLWNQGSGVLNSHKDVPVHPSMYWPSDQQSIYPNYHSNESNIGSALLQGVSVLQSGTGQNDMQHMTPMHRMGSDTASSESTIPQHVNQHGSIQQ